VAELRHVFEVVCVVVTAVVGAQEYEQARLRTERDEAQESFFQLIEGIGSPSLLTSIGALRRIPAQTTRAVPRDTEPYPGEGVLYMLGLHNHPIEYPYRSELLSTLHIAAKMEKPERLTCTMTTSALMEVLCDLGPEGWYGANMDGGIVGVRRNGVDCLSWIWGNAPSGTTQGIPAYRIFVKAELCDLQLSQKLLHAARFDSASIDGATFEGSDLRGANFHGAQLRSVDFKQAELDGALLSHKLLHAARFDSASIDGASFEGADLRGADFRGARLRSVDFKQAELDGALFEGACISDGDFDGARGVPVSALEAPPCPLNQPATTSTEMSRD
jgi:hypothetical protein